MYNENEFAALNRNQAAWDSSLLSHGRAGAGKFADRIYRSNQRLNPRATTAQMEDPAGPD